MFMGGIIFNEKLQFAGGMCLAERSSEKKKTLFGIPLYERSNQATPVAAQKTHAKLFQLILLIFKCIYILVI